MNISSINYNKYKLHIKKTIVLRMIFIINSLPFFLLLHKGYIYIYIYIYI